MKTKMIEMVEMAEMMETTDTKKTITTAGFTSSFQAVAPCRWLWVLLSMCLFALPATAASPEQNRFLRESTSLWHDGTEYLRLVPHQAQANGHPQELEPDTLRAMLASIQIYPPEEGGLPFFGSDDEPDVAVPLFSEQQLDRLAPLLSEGLQQAEQDEDVAFAITGSQPQLSGLAHSEVTTTGLLFHRDGVLHLILGEVNTSYKLAFKADSHPTGGFISKRAMERNPLLPGSRTQPADLEVTFPSIPGVSHFVQGEQQRDDWLMLTPGAAKPRAPESTTPAAAEPTTPGAPETPEVSDNPSAPEPSNVEARLRELKRLKDQNLIPEDVYRDKVEEILDSL